MRRMMIRSVHRLGNKGRGKEKNYWRLENAEWKNVLRTVLYIDEHMDIRYENRMRTRTRMTTNV